MSDTIAADIAILTAANTQLTTAVAAVGTELTTLHTELTAALAAVPVGTVVTADQAAALHAAAAGIEAQASALSSFATPPPTAA